MNIKAYIRSVLMDSEIINLTADKDVYFLHAENGNPPYIEYEIYNEDGVQWAENKEITTGYFVQVDIFSRGDYTELEEKIKEKMINAGFMKNGGRDLFEEDTKLYHKALRFVINK